MQSETQTMLKHIFASLTCAATLVSAAPLSAQNITADVDQIAKVLREEGFQAKIEGERGERRIETGMSGYNFLILPFDCDDDGNTCKSVQFYVGFAANNDPTLEEMNTYASENRFGRIYLDDDGDPIIEMDIDLEAGGMSRALFLDNLAYWEAIMVSFAEFAFRKDED